MQELNKLRFSKAESFQLVMTGLKYLRAYEHTSEQASLDRATEALARGVRLFPDDIAPKFYLGVAKAVSGPPNAAEAVALLSELDSLQIGAIQLQVKYNLAAAYVHTYDDKENFGKARNLLNTVVSDADGALRRQAEVLLLFLNVRELWSDRIEIQNMSTPERKRDRDRIDIFHKKADQLKHRLEEFKRAFDKENRTEYQRNEVLADYWNNKGIVEWYLAATDFSGGSTRRAHGEEALRCFEQSLKHKQSWAPPRSNMAEVSAYILGDFRKAEQIWRSIVRMESKPAYAMRCLGDLAAAKADRSPSDRIAQVIAWEEAVRWYRKAEQAGSDSSVLKIAKIELEKLQRPRDAKSTLEGFLTRLDPVLTRNQSNIAEAYLMLGRTEESLGNTTEASLAFQRSDLPEAQQSLARLLGSIPS